MNRITQTFQRLATQNRKALIGYITAGDPDYATSLGILRAAATSGLDILELGVPFSDPTADGPAIQAASQRALRTGMTLSRTLQLAADLRRHTDIPLMLFSYYNPIYKYGLERLATDPPTSGMGRLVNEGLPPWSPAP